MNPETMMYEFKTLWGGGGNLSEQRTQNVIIYKLTILNTTFAYALIGIMLAFLAGNC